jgi:hypothetical protein
MVNEGGRSDRSGKGWFCEVTHDATFRLHPELVFYRVGHPSRLTG